MTLEQANYIITYFRSFLSIKEEVVLRHYQHSPIIKEDGPLSKDRVVKNLMDKGPDQFILNTAERLIKEYPDVVFLNYCPKCGN